MNPIVILANKYPNEFDSNINVFTQQTAWTFADLGYECIVLCPSPINLNRTNRFLSKEAVELTEGGNSVKILRPFYTSMGQRPGPFNKTRVRYTVSHYVDAVIKSLRSNDIDPAIVFGEFLCPCGVAAVKVGDILDCPSFFQHGEALYFGDSYFGNDRLAKSLLKNLDGAIAVSEQNRNYLLDAGVVSPEKVRVFPNGCRGDRFFRRDKSEARERMGWPQDSFIVGMTASFDDRKGVLRLKKAVESIDGVYYACAGKGRLDPSGEKCLLASPVDNAELPWFLSALDAFVLPTYNEGCCTAIVEAISCGLPIVSSDRSFNYDICDSTNSILIDPGDISAIADAIRLLKKDDTLREKLSEGSLKKAPSLDLRNRIRNIASFMDEMTGGSLAGALKRH